MDVTWLSKTPHKGSVSIYRNNLTFNSVCLSYLKDAYMVRFGIEGDSLLVEPLSKERVLVGDIDEKTLFKVSLSSTYARVSSTELVGNIIEGFSLCMDQEPIKKEVLYKEGDRYLSIPMKGGDI